MKVFVFLNLVFLSLGAFGKNPDWKPVFKKDGIEVFASEAKSEGVIPFMAVAELEGDVEEFLAALKNHESKSLWAPKLKEVKLHKKISEQEYIFSEYYETPWPASDREFLLRGTIRKEGPSYHLLAESVDDNSLAEKNHVQVDVRTLHVILTGVSPGRTRISFEFEGDMKGWIPVWVSNIIQKRWPYLFIKKLRERVALR